MDSFSLWPNDLAFFRVQSHRDWFFTCRFLGPFFSFLGGTVGPTNNKLHQNHFVVLTSAEW